MAGAGRLLAADFAISLMWVFSNELIKIFSLGYAASQLDADILKCALSVANMFAFAYMGKLTHGGAYNPLAVLAPAISADFSNFLFTVGARIPAQVVGSIYGVRLIMSTFPWMQHKPHLKVDIATGALTEDLTGGCMNPAPVMGWAFANKQHITKEHLVVYWLAPVEATLIAVWLSRILYGTKKDKRAAVKDTSPHQKSKKSD
ncbi:probable aquaporin SIP2-1 isoform X2 [Salvia hispanica]|uniref:probable aquaporin SIP2-1 isoform X2 n=1 Tax=Salvia hispanica TaxID=49212 RepID=UPI0020095730|nr:probable aquaporin SIP2-1 isoform X2 [Salvia hispanica]